MVGRTATLERRPAPARPAGSGPGAAPGRGPGPEPGRRSATTGILLLVAFLAGLGLVAALFVRFGLEAPPVAGGRPADPARHWVVADAIDPRQLKPVWTLITMAGLERRCEKARAWTVSRPEEGPGRLPTRFILFCRSQGFWVIEADAEGERFGTVGPLARIEDAEGVIDKEGNFVWGARRPGQSNFAGERAP